MQADEAKENSPGVGVGGCSLADGELDAALIAMLDDVPRPLNESLASTSELIGMPSMLDSWEPSAQAALLEEPLSFELGSTESRLLSEPMTVLIPLGEPRCHTHSLQECMPLVISR